MVLVSAAFAGFAAHAQSVEHRVIPLNKSVTVVVSTPIGSSTIDAPEIVSARPLTAQKLLIQGKRIGTTDVSIYDDRQQLLKLIEIEVTLDTANLQAIIRASTGDRGIRVTADNASIVLSGTAADAVVADKAFNLAKAWLAGQPSPTGSTGAAGSGGPTVVNAISVASPQQVSLKVRFLEVDRNAGRQLGINWNGSNPAGNNGVSTGVGGVACTPPCAPPGNIFQTVGTLVGSSPGAPFGVVLAEIVNKGVKIDTLISALETKGLLQRLAEPNLVALSGQPASFRAGGQIPVPSPSSALNGPTFQYEPFGVQLKFTPTVLNSGIINLTINPTVSELDFAHAVTVSGTTVPGLTDRTATTTIELRDGQSFAIAGLLQADNGRDISQLPWAGTVPVLGALFRSSSYQKDETDLVIIVTPSLVHPAAPAQRLATPFDTTVPSNDVDFFLLGQMEQRKKYTDWVASGGNVRGPYGYMLGVMQGPDTSHLLK